MTAKTPICSALLDYDREKCLRLHMPGHAGGLGFDFPGFKEIGRFDVTEVFPFDNLQMPSGIIEESRHLLAQAFGAYESFFLVNGATSGIHTLFLSMINPGEKVLVPRNAHKSFFGGMVISGCEPVYIPCQVSEDFGLALSVSADDVALLLRENPNIKAIFLTSPTYYGTVLDIKAVAAETRMLNVPLIVDEAHGGHFSFHEEYPASALSCGADAAVNGLHKTLPVFNQGACLHIGEALKDKSRIFSSYTLLTTTSPSYPILASIEWARAFMEERGHGLMEQALVLSHEYKFKINQIKGLKCGNKFLRAKGVAGYDPLKVVVFCDGLNIDGYELAQILRNEFQIQVEMSEPGLILAMMSLFHTRDDWEYFYQSLVCIAQKYYGEKKQSEPLVFMPFPEVILTPREAFFAKKKRIRLEESRGLISAEMIAAYPPGIPCLLPGELISDEVYDYMCYLKMTGAKIIGPEDGNLDFIYVIEQ
ncbi:aminotransferase class I/II-fold pyridoxal phosphate-dependent enzyme [Thermosyntropha sp.]|uniref:aminotransferase class I/II-fold pyridoxal phosphate-dependent enzyme n=1 Tax=Thermosyntropha sp. TaxID=2740820 RepID=UPI0025EAEDD5|nr:aminotransferase class I/II-fold pyridoxal phosphate-dependent enzyme [Thermosyntropha sp.]MBO8159958.1 aminotransferase class I/II-fold pyridoxal phosphate-dependent enzyme [Thermosyntropha sp.]